MQKSPPPFIWACPEEKNILDCVLLTFPLDQLTDWVDRAFHHRTLNMVACTLIPRSLFICIIAWSS